MKRVLIKGILSATIVATCLVARGAAQVYSGNVGSLNYSTTTNSGSYLPSITEKGYVVSGSNPPLYFSSTTWQKGPFTFGEFRADVNKFANGLPPGYPPQSYTWFSFGNHSIKASISLWHIAVVGAAGAVVLGLIIGCLLKRGDVANPAP
jgi:hypothetical protein